MWAWSSWPPVQLSGGLGSTVTPRLHCRARVGRDPPVWIASRSLALRTTTPSPSHTPRSPARSSPRRAAGSSRPIPRSSTSTGSTRAVTSPPGKSPSCSPPRFARRSGHSASSRPEPSALASLGEPSTDPGTAALRLRALSGPASPSGGRVTDRAPRRHVAASSK